MMLLRVQKELRDRLGQKHLNELLSSFNDFAPCSRHPPSKRIPKKLGGGERFESFKGYMFTCRWQVEFG